ncbi:MULTISPECIES: cytochrome c1 [Comamonas]|uniref:Cytochrome c1 n=1 Tax=Comamonas koreensis TaxID=160825 RepID=A0AAW4XQG0_9BURK|nr:MULTISPECIES: cytochrome c1 [Comamonas]MCD2163715.1 cytochrome c1 [Comamonas koreensis]
MKKIILSACLGLGVLLGAGGTQAAEGGVAWDKFNVDTTNTTSLQNGAKLFVNYCLSCHSAAFMRYNRLQDIGLTEQQIKDNLLFTTDKVGETMKAAIDPKQAKEWFGANPPDLTLVARSRAGHQGTGADYLYTFLRGFYKDDTKATGWNNMAFPSVGMPHVLWELQGVRVPVYKEVEEHGHKTQVFTGWQQVTPGKMNSTDFDKSVGDLVNYLQWMGDPSQNTRKRVGVGVLIFLLGLIFITWRLNAAFWKDVK